MSEQLPEGWTKTRVGELFDLQLGKMVSKEATHGPNPAPYLANRHVQWDYSQLKALDTMSFSPAEREKYSLQPGDLLVCEGGEVGRTAMWRGEASGVYFQKAIHRLRPLGPRIEPRYMLRFMRRAADTGAFTDLVSQTSIAHLTREKLAVLEVPTPPMPEQQKIAEILDTVDEAIRKTDQIIAKLRQVKQGLLHDLLTRGIDGNGELRDPERHPEQFKDSLLGRIPKAWGVAPISELCETVVDCPHTTPAFTSEGVLVARTSHVRDGCFDSASASRVSEADYKVRVARLEPRPGDVIFTREAPVGEAFVIPPGMRICLGQRVMLLRPNSTRLDGDYLVAQIYSGAVARRIELLTGGTTNPHLNVSDARDFMIPIPPVHEQHQIADNFRASERRLARELETCRKLRTIKQGLAEDLLTGRVRTTNLLEPTP